MSIRLGHLRFVFVSVLIAAISFVDREPIAYSAELNAPHDKLNMLAGAETDAREEPRWLTQADKLVPQFLWDGVMFGMACSASDDIVVVSAPFNNPGGVLLAGSAYVFLRTGASWTEHQNLWASDPSPYDNLGSAVSLQGDTIFLSAMWQDPGGSVYVFTRSDHFWTEHQKLTGDASHMLGSCIANDGPDRLLVGTYDGETVYDFRLVGDQWIEHGRLTALQGVPEDHFGSFIATNGDTMMVAADHADHSALTDAGAVYVFERAGDSWAEVQKLTASDAASGDLFGAFVQIDGDTAVVGAPNDDHSGFEDAGSMYVFNRAGGVWTETDKLVAHDPGIDRGFGYSAWLDGNRLAIGSPTFWWVPTRGEGALYLFTRHEDTWVERQEFIPADAEVGDVFGHAVCASGGYIFAGAPGDSHQTTWAAGSQYVLFLALFVDGFESGDTSAWDATERCQEKQR